MAGRQIINWQSHGWLAQKKHRVPTASYRHGHQGDTCVCVHVHVHTHYITSHRAIATTKSMWFVEHYSVENRHKR